MAKNAEKKTENRESLEEVILRIEKIQQEDLAKRKTGIILRWIIIGIMVVWVWITYFSFQGIIKQLKSEDFQVALQQSSLNVGKELINKAGLKAKEVARDVYPEIKEDLDAYVPTLMARVKDEAVALTDDYIPNVVKQVNKWLEDIGTQTESIVDGVVSKVETQVQAVVLDTIDTVVSNMDAASAWLDTLDEAQFEELKNAIMLELDKNVRTIISSELTESIDACVTQGHDAIMAIRDSMNWQNAGLEDLYIVTFKTFTEALKLYQMEK